MVWAYKQGFLDATQVLTDSVKSLDDAKIDRPLARLTVLGLSDGVTTTAQEPTASLTPAAESAATAEPSIVSREGWGKLIVHHTATSNVGGRRS